MILSTYETAKKRGDRFIEMVRAKFNPPAAVAGCGAGFLKVSSYHIANPIFMGSETSTPNLYNTLTNKEIAPNELIKEYLFY